MFRPPQTLTFDNAAAVLDAGLRAIAGGQADIDLAGLTAVDSSAVAVLLAWQRAARKLGKPLAFLHLPPDLQSLIRLYGIDPFLPGTTGADPAHH